MGISLIIVTKLFQHHSHLRRLLDKTGKRVADIRLADGAIRYLFCHGTFTDVTIAFGMNKFDTIGSATRAIDMLRFDVRVVLFGPFPGDFLPLSVIILPGSNICLTFFTIQPTT